MLQQAGSYEEIKSEEAPSYSSPSFEEVQVHGANSAVHQALLSSGFSMGTEALQHCESHTSCRLEFELKNNL